MENQGPRHLRIQEGVVGNRSVDSLIERFAGVRLKGHKLTP